jgi:hypothetical protein
MTDHLVGGTRILTFATEDPMASNRKAAQIRSRLAARTIMVELGCRAHEIGGGPAQANGITVGQGRLCVPDRAPARAGPA